MEYPEWESESRVPVSIMPTSHTLLSEQEYDASKDENFIEVPALEFFKRCALHWDGSGSYLTGDKEIAFICPALYEPGPYTLLAEREFLETFLNESNLALVWTVLAEKQCVRGWSGNTPGYTKHSRTHVLKDGSILSSEGVSQRLVP